MVPQHSICAVTKATWWRQRWLKWGFQHGLLHLLGVERSIPDSQLCSWQHILGNTTAAGMHVDQQISLLTEVKELRRFQVEEDTWEVLKYTSSSCW